MDTEEQEQFTLRRVLTPVATDWHSHQGGTWHANPRLMVLQRILTADDNWLNAKEVLFVRRSTRRRKAIRIGIASFLAAVMIALSVTTYFSITARNEAVLNTRESNRQTANAYWQVAVDAKSRSQNVEAGFNFLRASQACEAAGEHSQRRSCQLAAAFATADLIRSFPHDSWVGDVVVSDDQTRFLSWTSDKIIVWDVATAKPIQIWDHEGDARGAVFTRDGTKVLTRNGTDWIGEVRLWDVAEVEPIRVWKHEGRVHGAVFTSDETCVLSWSGVPALGEVKLWDIALDKPLQTWNFEDEVNGAVLTRDEANILVWGGGLSEGYVQLLDAKEREPTKVWKHQSNVYRAMWSSVLIMMNPKFSLGAGIFMLAK